MTNEVKLNHKDILSHLILQDMETAMQINDTPQWDGGKGTLEMDIKVNGVTVPTEVFRKVMENMWKQARTQAADAVDESKYKQRVQEAASKKVQECAGQLLETMNDLQNKLHDTDQLVKWNWED